MKMVCDSKECNKRNRVINGILYLYGKDSQYVERCLPCGHVTRRGFSIFVYAAHSFAAHCTERNELQSKYVIERGTCGALVAVIIRMNPIPSGEFKFRRFSVLDMWLENIMRTTAMTKKALENTALSAHWIRIASNILTVALRAYVVGGTIGSGCACSAI